nr:protein FAM169B isoform X1 [Manis javanica]
MKPEWGVWPRLCGQPAGSRALGARSAGCSAWQLVASGSCGEAPKRLKTLRWGQGSRMMPLVSRTGWLRTQRLRATGKQRVGAPPGTSGHLDLAGIYPVDILEDDPKGNWEAALAYYAMLAEGGRSSPEVFSLPTGEQVKLEAASVCFYTVHRDEPQHKILVLVKPQDTKTVVAVYVKGSWWATEDVLRTSDPAREGLMKVQSFGERIVLFILNVVVFGRLERNLDDDGMFFLPHSVKEHAKILWRGGAAVGFYTVKPKGSLCGDGVGVCYLLPVFDTVFIRRRYRRQGLGTAMLQDFCETFQEDEALGVSWPVSPAMYQVCRKFLGAHPEERGRLWEVEPPGAWGQRDSIWLKVQPHQSRLSD